MSQDVQAKVTEYWDKVAADFDAIYSGAKGPFQRAMDRWFRKDMYQRFDWVMERAGDVAGQSVCDVGCGSGRFVAALARRGAAHLTGVDVAPEMIRLARELVAREGVCERCDFLQGDILDLEIDRSYDLTIAIGLWDYIPDPIARLTRIRRLTRGKFLSAWPRRWTWRAPVRKVRLGLLGCPVYFFSRSDVRRYLGATGFRVTREDVVGKLYCVEADPVQAMVPLTAFWLAAGIVIYVYAGYPLVLVALRGLLGRTASRKASTTSDPGATPTVSLLVAAYNEADVIGAKIQNALALDYPSDRLEIVVASDGSRDGTAEIVRRFCDDPRVRLFDYPENRGKLHVLNVTVPQLKGEIVAFSDASSMLTPDAMGRLLAHFADPRVGAVSGVYKVTEQDQAPDGKQEDFYWRYETFLKLQEAAIGSILGCHGSLYAIRKRLYPFPDPHTINDDYVIPLRIIQQGYRVGYEPAALATEHAKEMGGFSRRIRIMTGNFRQFRELTALLRPVRPLELFFFFSHKAGRLIVPWAMIVAFFANVWLLGQPFFQWMLAAQLGFYALAAAGAIWPLRPRVLRLPYFFSMINAASFLGLYFAVRRRSAVAWKGGSAPLVSTAGDPDPAPCEMEV